MLFQKKLILFCNIYFSFLNISFLLFNKNKQFIKKVMNQIRYSDLLPFLFSNKNYLEISNYLNSKYGVNKFIFKLNQKIMHKRKIRIQKNNKKTIVLYSVDLFSLKFHKNWLKAKLKDNFIIKFDPNNPDYLIYNVFGSNHLNPKYNNSIKIAIFTENKIPNFNEVDYAIGHYHINYLDRYFKYNLFMWKNIKTITFI